MGFCMYQLIYNWSLWIDQHLEGPDMSADTKIAELLTELHQLIKQTQVSKWDW